jgi:Family of unknown function (DUF6335)
MAKTKRRTKAGSAARAGRSAAARRAAAARKRLAKRRTAGRKSAVRAVKARPAAKAARKRLVKRSRKVAAKRTAKRAVTRAAVTKSRTKAISVKAAARMPKAKPKTKPKAKMAPTPTVQAKRAAAPPVRKPATPKPARRPPGLDRERRTVGEPAMVPMPPSSLVPGHASAARSGGDELRVKLATHTSSGPVLTAGDVDADWGAAESVGDEAPGGDNPTPDQDVVDEIGRALGVEYDDDEELQGGDEIAGRDRDRWELDPASSDDFDER